MTHPSVDTWDLTAGFPQGCLVDRLGIMAPLDGTLMQRRQTLSSTGPNGKNALREWSMTFRDLGPTEYAQLMSLIDNSANGCEPIDLTVRGFSLTGGTSETVQVRILNNSISLRAESPVRYAVSIDLGEFLHAP